MNAEAVANDAQRSRVWFTHQSALISVLDGAAMFTCRRVRVRASASNTDASTNRTSGQPARLIRVSNWVIDCILAACRNDQRLCMGLDCGILDLAGVLLSHR